MNDADIEMAELTAAANHESRLRRKAICAHGACRVRRAQSKATCADCGKVFDTEADLHEERQEVLS